MFCEKKGPHFGRSALPRMQMRRDFGFQVPAGAQRRPTESMVLEVVPHALVGIQFRGIRGQEEQTQPTLESGDVLPDGRRAVFGPRPSINSDIAFELGAVAKITCAPPSFCNACAAFVDLLSMYTLAPSFFASAAFSDPRPIAATS